MGRLFCPIAARSLLQTLTRGTAGQVHLGRIGENLMAAGVDSRRQLRDLLTVAEVLTSDADAVANPIEMRDGAFKVEEIGLCVVSSMLWQRCLTSRTGRSP